MGTIEDDRLDHIEGITSSVGAATWPPEKGSFNRLKGIDTRLHITMNTINPEIELLHGLSLTPEISRVSARLIFDYSILHEIEESHSDLLEGVVLLQGCGVEELDNAVIGYFGRNHKDRVASGIELSEKTDRAFQIFSNGRDEPPSHRFELRTLTQDNAFDDNFINSFIRLNGTFGWKASQAIELLNNPNNIVIGCFDGDLLIGSGIAERFTWNIQVYDSKKVILHGAELTEAIVDRSYRGKRIYETISNAEIHALLNNDVHFVFGESNLNAPGVLKAAHNQGRHLGLVRNGNALSNHVTIGGEFSHFAPTYMTRADMERNFRSKI